MARLIEGHASGCDRLFVPLFGIAFGPAALPRFARDPAAAEKLTRFIHHGSTRAAQTQIEPQRRKAHRPPSSSFNWPASQRLAGYRTSFGRNGRAILRPSPAEA